MHTCCCNFFAKIFALLSKEEALRLLTNRFFNSDGSKGGKKPLDLEMNNLNFSLTMLCLSGFELCPRWVPLNKVGKRTLTCTEEMHFRASISFVEADDFFCDNVNTSMVSSACQTHANQGQNAV